MTKNVNEWLFWLNFFFFEKREEPITKYPKGDPLNQKPWGGPWRGTFELRADLAKQNSTARSRVIERVISFMTYKILKIHRENMT